MKKSLLTIIFVFITSILFAGNLDKLCELINKQQYNRALKVLSKVDEMPIEEVFVYLDRLEEFIDYSINNNVSEETFEKLLFWYAEESIMYADLLLLTSSSERFNEAEYYYLTAIEIYKELEDSTSLLYIQKLKQLFLLYSENNELEKSIVVLKNIIELEKLNSDSLTLYSDYIALGSIYYRKGENVKSDSIYEVAESLITSPIEKLYSMDFDLVKLYAYLIYRDYSRALCEADKLQEKNRLYAKNNEVVNAISNTYKGAVFLYLGNISDADSLISESYKILSKVANDERYTDVYITSSLLNARIKYISFDFEKAKQILSPILKEKPSVLTERYWSYIAAVNSMGVIHFFEKDYYKAYEYIKETIESYEFSYSLGANTKYEYATSLYQQSLIEERLNLLLESYSSSIKSYELHKDLVKQNLSFLSEEQRNEYWNEIQFRITNEFPSLFYKFSSVVDSVGGTFYDNELFYKGILLSTTHNIHSAILQSGDSALISLYDELHKIQTALISDKIGIGQSDLLKRRDDIDKLLTNRSNIYRESKNNEEHNWRDVQKSLQEYEVAIEFSSFDLFRDRFTDSTMYCALLLRHNSKYPELIPLFEEKEVSSYLNKIKDKYDNNNLYSARKDGIELTQLVWSKLLPNLKEGETIYFAPTGILHQLAIEYLPYDEQRTMSDVYNMVRLSSTREIVTNKSKEVYKSAVVYGGIFYDVDNKDILAESNRYPGLKRSSLENDSINRGSARFLPGTKEEAEKINKLLADNKIEAVIYKTKSANEESFKSLSGKHNNILHIATHGFTWTDSTARKQDYFADRMKMQLMGDNQMRGPIIDPLDRCGLLFAGANTALQGKSNELPDGVQDGILTAKEISLMDLRDAELVVLSACETAKGDITSEGVYGLQRAFKMAGAKTIIMSLWKVDDNATQMLMTAFYNNWISKKQSKREAFKNAQKAVSYAVDEEGDLKFNQPYYWAGFIMLD